MCAERHRLFLSVLSRGDWNMHTSNHSELSCHASLCTVYSLRTPLPHEVMNAWPTCNAGLMVFAVVDAHYTPSHAAPGNGQCYKQEGGA